MKESMHAYGRDGKRLENGLGICGGNADLCAFCHKAEFLEVFTWAKDKPGPVAGESISGYWTRIGGQFLDVWYSVAADKFRDAELTWR